VIVLGIDPGLARTGYAVVEGGPRPRALAIGVVRTSPETDHGRRLVELGHALKALIEEHRPDVAAVERLFFNSNARSAMAVGQAAGVAIATAAEAGLEVVDYTPLEVKRSVVGVGNASKHQVQTMVAALLRLQSAPRPADAADACALAICHLHGAAFARALDEAAR
jgi:crossover junction endodeoxyribonuclease RuvC